MGQLLRYLKPPPFHTVIHFIFMSSSSRVLVLLISFYSYGAKCSRWCRCLFRTLNLFPPVWQSWANTYMCFYSERLDRKEHVSRKRICMRVSTYNPYAVHQCDLIPTYLNELPFRCKYTIGWNVNTIRLYVQINYISPYSIHAWLLYNIISFRHACRAGSSRVSTRITGTPTESSTSFQAMIVSTIYRVTVPSTASGYSANRRDSTGTAGWWWVSSGRPSD